MDDQLNNQLECVDTSVGERILELESSTLDADERILLEAHRDVCSFCRLTLDLHHRLGSGIRDGSLEVNKFNDLKIVQQRKWTGWTAAVAIAASLVLVMVLPPRPVGPTLVERGTDDAQFLQPVEGEVVRDGELTLAWTDVPGADSYRVQITGLNEGFTWQGTSDELQLVVPQIAGLTSNETYRVLLSTVPADLLPPGGTSVSFRTGGFFAVASHRVRRAQPVSYMLALSGLAMAFACMIRRRS